MAGFSIISLEPAPIPFIELADVYIKALHVLKGTARTKARDARYFILDDAGREETISVFRALRGRGYQVQVVPPEKQVEMGKPLMSANIDAEPGAFSYHPDSTGKRISLPWDGLWFFCTGYFKEEQEDKSRPECRGYEARVYNRDGSELRPLRKGIKLKTKKFREHTFCDIVFSDPPLYLRIKPRSMNYDYLLDRKTPNSTANFRILLHDLARFAPTLYVTVDLVDFACRKGKFRPRKFDSKKAYEDYVRWNLLLLILGINLAHGPKPASLITGLTRGD